MSDLKREGPPRELTILRKHQESNTMLAIIMAGIAALFIVAIIAAYDYAASTNTAANNPPATASAPAGTTGSAARAPAMPAETTGSAARAPATSAETTGSGSAERGAPAQQKKPSVGF